MKEHYLENAKGLMNALKSNHATFSSYLGDKRLKSTVIPTYSKNDDKFKMAKYA